MPRLNRLKEVYTMKSTKCPYCRSVLVKNGFTSARKQRWRCKTCSFTTTHSYDDTLIRFKEFTFWLFSSHTQDELKISSRTFRRRISQFWKYWPQPIITGEIYPVIYIDGIYLARNLVILIAISDTHVLSWYIARKECRRAYRSLLENIPEPLMVVIDGGSGCRSSLKEIWPHTKIQRCLFHVFSQVRRYTTSRPKLQAGVELYSLAKRLLHIKDLRSAQDWCDTFIEWSEFYQDFLEEKTFCEGRYEYTHKRLVQARRSLATLISQRTLFTYLDPELTALGSKPATNNKIEGWLNASLRRCLRNHRGISLLHRIKTVCWWCYLHSEIPPVTRESFIHFPTDDDKERLLKLYSESSYKDDLEPTWEDRAIWEEPHTKSQYPHWYWE